MSARSLQLLVFSGIAAVSVAACAPRERVAAPDASASGQRPIMAAQRISLDGSHEAVAAAPSMLNNEPAALAARARDEVHLPDGTVGVRVAKRYYHTIVVCRQPDGSFSTECPAAPAAAATATGAKP